MPRHRLQGRPSLRAQRQESWPSRGVRSDAAALGSHGPRTVVVSAAGALAVRPEYLRMFRNVMFTPWFAVSVGIVVAASLTLATPRAALTFPPSAGGHCAEPGCQAGRAGGRPGQAQPNARRVLKLHLAGKRYLRPQPSPIEVDYQLLPRRHGQFMAVIVLVSRKTLGKWDLRLVLPGAYVTSVMWARWEHDGSAGLVIQGSPLPWPRSGTNEARIVILGTGTPGQPRGCVIDDARCTFRALAGYPGPSAPIGHRWPHRTHRRGHRWAGQRP